MKDDKKIFLLVVILFSYLNLQSQASLSIKNIAPALLKGANAVIRYDTQVYSFLAIDKLELQESYAITILNKKGESYLSFYAGYQKDVEKIKDIKLSYLDKDGIEIKKVKKKEIKDYSTSDGYSLITDYRIKHYKYHTNQYPITIKCSYKKTSKNTIIPSWWPIVDYKIALEESNFTILNQTNIPIHSLENNLNKYGINSSNDLVYHAENLKAIQREKQVPRSNKIFPNVGFGPETFEYNGYKGTFSSWKKYGQWIYDDFLKGRDISLTRTQISQMIGKDLSALDDREIVKAIYEYTQTQTRYVSISIEEGGWKPMSAKSVHDLKYGDCKALTFYTQSLLKTFQIPSEYVIVNADSDANLSIDPDFCNGYQANHIILRVPLSQDTIWLDCTSSKLPFNFLGNFTDDRKVLLVGEDESKIGKTPKYSFDLNHRDLKAQVTITENGDIQGVIDINNYGIPYVKTKAISEYDNKELNEYLKSYLFKGFKKLAIENSSFAFVKDSILAKEQYQIKAQNYGEKAGEYLLIPIAFMPLKIPRLKKDKNRVSPIVFYRDKMTSSKISYSIPINYSIGELPKPQKTKNEYFEYSLEIESFGEEIKVKRIFKLYEGNYNLGKYNEIKNQFDSIRKVELSTITLVKK